MNEFIQQIREQVGRIWADLSMQQKALFISAPLILLISMGAAIYLASRPEMVSLVRSDDKARLSQIADYLTTNNIKYALSGENTILVDKADRSKVALQLAGQGLIGPDFGPGFELFDQTRLGMTENMFEMQRQRAMENTLAKAIVEGAPNITQAFVRIVIPTDKLFKEDQAEPTATVKIHTQGSVDKSTVEGIQRLVAASVEKMNSQKVVVVDGTNKLLSEDSDVEPGVAQARKHFQYQKVLESDMARKLEDKLYFLVGPDNFQVSVTMVLDWEDRKIKNVNFDNSAVAPVSTKAYDEESTTPGIAGQPGVGSNVQDSGLGAEATLTKTKITEEIINNQYPWSETFINEEQGEIKKISVGIAINQKLDDNDQPIKRDPQILAGFEENLKAAINFDPIVYQFHLFEHPFDTSLLDRLAQERFWNNLTSAAKNLLPLLLLLALGYFAYIFFQRAFAPPEIEEEMEEEVPIEPITDSRELTLSQLGLAEFGDIASLPAEEQRRIKMQEHVINYAAEKPEEVAQIIKAWLSS
ncbi:MAG: flagellar basal-body MS-ring/collar protein FliF [Candidatus Omnitrophota bacterium]